MALKCKENCKIKLINISREKNKNLCIVFYSDSVVLSYTAVTDRYDTVDSEKYLLMPDFSLSPTLSAYVTFLIF